MDSIAVSHRQIPPYFYSSRFRNFSHKVHNLTRNSQVSGDPCLLYIRPVAGEVEIDGAQPGSTACGFPEWGGAGGWSPTAEGSCKKLVTNGSEVIYHSYTPLMWSHVSPMLLLPPLTYRLVTNPYKLIGWNYWFGCCCLPYLGGTERLLRRGSTAPPLPDCLCGTVCFTWGQLYFLPLPFHLPSLFTLFSFNKQSREMGNIWALMTNMICNLLYTQSWL